MEFLRLTNLYSFDIMPVGAEMFRYLKTNFFLIYIKVRGRNTPHFMQKFFNGNILYVINGDIFVLPVLP